MHPKRDKKYCKSQRHGTRKVDVKSCQYAEREEKLAKIAISSCLQRALLANFLEQISSMDYVQWKELQ